MWHDGLTLSSWADIRKAIKEAFDSCMVCHSPNNLDVHHIDPKGMGGRKSADTPDNAALLCRMCHNEIHNGHAKMWRDGVWVFHQPRGEGGRIIWELSPPAVVRSLVAHDAGSLSVQGAVSYTGRENATRIVALAQSDLSQGKGNAPVVPVRTDAVSWFEKELHLKQLGRRWCQTSIEMGKLLSEFHDSPGSYQSLGYESFEEFLGQPDMPVKPRLARYMMAAWKVWAPSLASAHVQLEELAQVGDVQRLAMGKKLLDSGMEPQEALSKVRELSRSDLKAEIDETEGRRPGRWCYTQDCPPGLFRGRSHD